MVVAGVVTALLIADDVSGIGAADDPVAVGTGIATVNAGRKLFQVGKILQTIRRTRAVSRLIKLAKIGMYSYHAWGAARTTYGEIKNLAINGKLLDPLEFTEMYTNSGRMAAAFAVGGEVLSLLTPVTGAVGKFLQKLSPAGQTAVKYGVRALGGGILGGGRAYLHGATIDSKEFWVQAGVSAVIMMVGGALSDKLVNIRTNSLLSKYKGIPTHTLASNARMIASKGIINPVIAVSGGVAAMSAGLVNRFVLNNEQETYGWTTAFVDFLGGYMASSIGSRFLGWQKDLARMNPADVLTRSANAREILVRRLLGKRMIG